MSTITVEVTDHLRAFVDRKVASKQFADAGSFLRELLEDAAEREEINRKLQVAEVSIARGEFSEWKPGDGARQVQEVLRRHARKSSICLSE